MQPLLAYKEKAIQLRKGGRSYREIIEQVPVAKSTLSLWLKNIPLDQENRERLYKKQIAILSFGPKSQRVRRQNEIDSIQNNAKKEIRLPLSKDAHQLMGAALYWAEGTKRKNFEITNSDPRLIVFMVNWIEKIFGVTPSHLKARLNIYPQQDELDIKKFWSELTGIPLEHFGKSFVKPISTGYKKNNLYYGTIKVYLPKGTDSIHRVYGWIQAVMGDIDSKVKMLEHKWGSLQETKRPVNLT